MIYAPAMLELRRHVEVHAFAHVTGGGIPGNLVRVLPDTLRRRSSERGSWDEPRIFAEIQAAGAVADDEMEHVFNLGLGMLAVVPRDDAFRALDVVRAAGHDAWLGRRDRRRPRPRARRRALDAQRLLEPAGRDPRPLAARRARPCSRECSPPRGATAQNGR